MTTPAIAPTCEIGYRARSHGLDLLTATVLLIFTIVGALDDALGQKDNGDELALVERAQHFDEQAWQTIYDRYYRRLFGYLYYRVGDADEAEELVAQVFERAVKHIGRYRYRGTDLGAWLNRIAANLAHDTLRRQKTQPPAPLELNEVWISGGIDPAQKALHAESSQMLVKALSQLTPDQQEVILLRFVARMTSPEIGRQMGKTNGAIKALQHRALAALRREMEALNYHGLS